MRFAILIATALVPLVITPGVLAYFDVTPKIAVFLCAVALILLYARTNIYNVKTLYSNRAGRLFIALIAAEWITAAAATALSLHPALSLFGGTWRRYGLISQTGVLLFVLLAAGWLAADRTNLPKLLSAAAVATMLASLYGIAQYFGIDPLLPAGSYQVGETPFRIVRPPGTVGHADYFADWLVVSAFLVIGLSALEHRRWAKRAAVAVSVLGFFAILLTGTRAALLAALAGLFVFAVTRGRGIHRREMGVGFACMLGLLLFFYSPAGGKLRARVHWSIEDARGGARLLLWRDAANMAVHRVWSGFGPETFATEFARFESIDLARAYPDFYHESPHNMFLDALTTEGVFGLAALLSLCLLSATAASRAWRSGNPLAAPLAAAFVAGLVAQQFSVFVLTTALYFHLVLALLIAISAPPQTAPPQHRLRWIVLPSAATAVLLVVFCVRLLISDRALAVGQRRLASGDVTGAAQAYRAMLRWQVPGSGADLDYSRAMQELASRSQTSVVLNAASQEALESGIRAVVNAEDRQNAWYNLATLLAARGDAPGVERALRNAIAWAPNWFKPHWALAQFLELTHRHEEALSQASAAVERDGNRDTEVSATWQKLRQVRQ